MSDNPGTGHTLTNPQRRHAALLGVIVVHLGALWWFSTLKLHSTHDRAPGEQEIRLSFFAPPPAPMPSPDRHAAAASVAAAPKAHTAILQAPGAITINTPTPPANSEPTAAPNPGPGFGLDLDKHKQSAVALTLAEMHKNPEPEHAADNKIAQAISQAARPKCDNDYKPKVAGIALDGLMKVPSLLGSAVSDKGCKW